MKLEIKFTQIVKFLKVLQHLMRGLKIKDTWSDTKKSDVLLVSYYSSRSYCYKGKSYGPLLDSIANTFHDKGVSCSYLSLPYLEIENCSETYNDYKTLNRKFFPVLIASFFSCVLRRKNFTKTRIEKEIPVWLNVLSSISPRIVIGIQPPKSLCAACHKLSIKVYDFQHGVISETMPAYSQYFIKSIATDFLPSGYLCWDNKSADVIRTWASDKMLEVYTIGHPWINRFIFSKSSDELVNLERQSISIKSQTKKILVTLQWGLGYYYPKYFKEGEVIHSVLIEAMGKIKGIDWLLRLHPIQAKDATILAEVEKIAQAFDNVFVRMPTVKPLPILMSMVEGHITWDSSSVIEAAKMGVGSFVINPSGYSPIQVHEKGFSVGIESNEIPFLLEEKLGMVTRSSVEPLAEEILHWVNTLSMNESKVKNNVQHFDEYKLLNLVRV